MQHNQDMLTEHEGAWGDKVKIIGLSIDKDAATVKNHITNKGWTKPIHYWRSKSDCSDVYSVRGVPHVMLVDTKGKIVFKGHPANRPDLAADMTTLLAGGEISGEGCAEVQPKEGEVCREPVVPDGFKACTAEELAAINAEMDAFKETGKTLQEECKEDAKGMMRDFCVLVMSSQLSPQTMGWAVKYENYRVLVGAQAKIDAINEKIKAKLEGGTFKVNEQFHPM